MSPKVINFLLSPAGIFVVFLALLLMSRIRISNKPRWFLILEKWFIGFVILTVAVAVPVIAFLIWLLVTTG
jgi:hypothetical protein